MSTSSGEDFFLLENVFLKIQKQSVHPINKKRKKFGEYHHLFQDMKVDKQKFYKYTRMTPETFYYILDKVEHRLIKKWCNWHQQPILPEERLVVTIRCRSRVSQEITTENLTKPHYAASSGTGVGSCQKRYENFPKRPGEIYCNTTYDGYLCWPPTIGSQTSAQHCPAVRLSDATQFAFRQCGMDGRWLGKHVNDTNPLGWTNYTPCFPPVVRSLFYKVYDEDEADAQYKFEIAENTRTIEIVGFTLSFILLSISLFILHNYKALHNLRTRIHMNLFAAMNAQVVVRLIVYIDQAVMRLAAGTPSYTGISKIEEISPLCVSMYVILEYFSSVMFFWMLNEGYYLNTLVTSNVLRDNNSYKYFWLLGWVAPLFITAAWSIVAAIHYGQDPSLGCWYGYNFLPYFWVMQGPRLSVILINFFFLLNIMRVLVLKLRQDTSSDVVKARKAVKAAMVLLPLLGITNILSMFEGPVAGPVWLFALWSYSTHSLRSFQGAFLAILYCFFNSEVHAVLSKSFANRLTIFRYRYPRLARFLGLRRRRRRPPGSSSGDGGSGLRPGDIPLRTVRLWTPRSQTMDTVANTANVSETELGGPSNIESRRQPLVHFNEVPVTIEIPRITPEGEYSPPRTT